MSLREYRKKRNFKKTPEPIESRASRGEPIFVIQEHHASHLHYDFRLEAFGTLKSWAVPKGPPTEPGDKRLAVEVEDHPIAYAKFKGRIPEGEYGAGVVKIWDHGTWVPPEKIKESLEKGHLEFELKGKRLRGRWLLQRTRKTSGKKNQWLLIKRHDHKVPKSSEIMQKKKTKADPFPEDLKPQLATLFDEAPKGADWVHEIKHDGYRTISVVRKGVRMLTRSGLDWTEKYPSIAEDLKSLSATTAILDGEIVALDENGRSSFSELQKALKSDDYRNVVYYVFDLLYLDGRDLRQESLEIRKQILKKLLEKSSLSKLRFSEHLRGQDELFKIACQQGLEGIVSKDRNAPYQTGKRTPDWRKIKCSLRQEVVIGGFTDPAGEREGFGALLVGVYDGKDLRYVGKVGTGFTAATIRDLKEKFATLKSAKSPFKTSSPKKTSKIHWLEPELIAEVEFKTWTGDRNLRHASYQGLRGDKAPGEVKLEAPKHEATPQRKAADGKFRITHPGRIVYEKPQIRKIDIASYYKSVMPWLIPHLSRRPLSLVRCPDQTGPACFFQKHVDSSKFPAVFESQVDDERVNYVDTENGVLELVQWGVIEFHNWQTRIAHSGNADQIVFDLDPDESVSWDDVVQGAFRIRDLLLRLSLESYVKTTGGKGLHVHLPIKPLYDWQKTKAFAKTICRKLEADFPGEYLSTSSKKARKGKIFLDYLRNGKGSTSVAPYSLRAKDAPFVATPVSWKELEKLKSPQEFTMHTTLRRLAHQKKDPWSGYDQSEQEIAMLR